MCPKLIITLPLIVLAVLLNINLYKRQSEICNANAYTLSTAEQLSSIISALILLCLGAIFYYSNNLKFPISSASIHKIDFQTITTGVFLLIAFIVLIILEMKKTNLQIRSWLKQHGYELIDLRGSGSKNPWEDGLGWGTSESQAVYKVEVRDANQTTHTAYILWGGYFGLSLFTGEIPVKIVFDSPKY